MTRNLFIVLTILCMIVPGIAAAAIYKWVDANGVVTFRDTPPPDAGKMKNLEVRPDNAGSAKPESTPAPEAGSTNEQQPAETVTPPPTPTATTANVELYSTSWCPYCKKAAQFLRSRGIDFTEYDIEKDADAARRKNALDSQQGVPFALINGRSVHGFSEAGYQRALDMKE